MAAVLYVMVSGCSKSGADLKSLATGPMAKLVLPAQPASEPDIAFTGPDGKPMKLADLKGQVVVVNFWATWCGPCKEEMPSLAKMSKDYADRGLKVVAISVDRLQDGAAARDFLKTHGGLQFYNDPDYRVVFGLVPRPDGIPTTVIYDKAGKEQARLSGGADWSTDQAKKVMDAVLAKG
ncbi:MAG TPA: TlpA disulfide reductase family protein [Caulobacteraceae bacterium]|jgi:thiol-disulfide isomerase/thioredoxin